MSKQLLIESCEFLCNLDKSRLQESLQLENKNNRLILRGVPCTILDKKNQNGRIYPNKEMATALNNAKALIESRAAYCQSHDHPQGSYVKPIEASHIVLNAYIENVNGVGPVLFNDWEILNTDNGKNLRALIEANCSIGTSIRGLGNMKGESVVDYEFLGTDCVGNPSSSTYTRMFEKPIVIESVLSEDELGTNISDTGNLNTSIENDSGSNININTSDDSNMDLELSNSDEISNVDLNSNLNNTDNSSLGEQKMENKKFTEDAEKAITKEPESVTTPTEVNVTEPTPAVEVLPTASNPEVGYAPSEKDPSTVVTQNISDVVNVATREGEKLAIRNKELMSIINKHNEEMSEKQRELDNTTRLLGEACNRLKAYKAEFGENTMKSLTESKEEAVKAVKEQAIENATAFVEGIVDRATNMVEDILVEAKVHTDKLRKKYAESQAINEQVVKYFKASQKINESLSKALRTVYNSNRKSVRCESAARKFHKAHIKNKFNM